MDEVKVQHWATGTIVSQEPLEKKDLLGILPKDISAFSFEPKVLYYLLAGVERPGNYSKVIVDYNDGGTRLTMVAPLARWSTIEAVKQLKTFDKIVEIGVKFGDNAFTMGQLMKPKELVLVDLWEEYEKTPDNWVDMRDRPIDTAKGLLSLLPCKKTFIKENSQTAHTKFTEGEFDYIFVDGDHSYEGCLADLKNWYPKLRKGGIIAGDDWNYPGVEKAVKEFFPKYELDENKLEWLVRP